MYRKKSKVALHSTTQPINTYITHFLLPSATRSCLAVAVVTGTSIARGVAAGGTSGSRTRRKSEARAREGCERGGDADGESEGWDTEGW